MIGSKMPTRNNNILQNVTQIRNIEMSWVPFSLIKPTIPSVILLLLCQEAKYQGSLCWMSSYWVSWHSGYVGSKQDQQSTFQTLCLVLCLGWGSNPGPLHCFHFFLTLYRWATVAPQSLVSVRLVHPINSLIVSWNLWLILSRKI